MQILEKIYTKYFDSKDAAIQFIEKHKNQHGFLLEYDLVGGVRWIVSKYKNWD